MPASVPTDRLRALTAVSARERVLLKTMKAVITAQYQRVGETNAPPAMAIAEASVTWIGMRQAGGYEAGQQPLRRRRFPRRRPRRGRAARGEGGHRVRLEAAVQPLAGAVDADQHLPDGRLVVLVGRRRASAAARSIAASSKSSTASIEPRRRQRPDAGGDETLDGELQVEERQRQFGGRAGSRRARRRRPAE